LFDKDILQCFCSADTDADAYINATCHCIAGADKEFSEGASQTARWEKLDPL